MDNPDILTILGIPDTGRRQTQKQNTTQKAKQDEWYVFIKCSELRY